MTRVYCRSPVASFTLRTDGSPAKSPDSQRSVQEAMGAVQAMVMPNRKSVLLAALSLAVIINILPSVPTALAQEMPRAAKAEPPADDKRWQAVAPGRIEPTSGEIKISAPVIGTVAEVLVRANDKVFAGEPLIRLVDTDAQARKATAEAQVAMRRRVRNDENASRAAATRRRAEDAVFDGERAVSEALAGVDR